MTILLIITICILVALIFALERPHIQEALRIALMFVTGAFFIAPMRDFLGHLIGSASGFMAAQAAHGNKSQPVADSAESAVPNGAIRTFAGYHLSRFLVSLILTGMTVVFILFELQVNRLTFDAMGLTTGGGADVPKSLSMVSALALICVIAGWGLVLLDLHGYTHFMPEFPPKLQRILTVAAWSFIGLGIITALIMGIWRGIVVSSISPAPIAATDSGSLSTGAGSPDSTTANSGSSENETAEQAPSGFDLFARLFVNGVLPTVVVATAVMTLMGVIWLAIYIAVIATGILLAVPALLHFLVLPLWDNLVGHLILLKDSVVNWIVNIGQRLIDNFWPPIKAFRNSVHRWAAKKWGAAAPPAAANNPGPAPASEVTYTERPLLTPHHYLDNGNSAVVDGSVRNGNGRHAAGAAAAQHQSSVGTAVIDNEPEDERPIADMNWGLPNAPIGRESR